MEKSEPAKRLASRAYLTAGAALIAGVLLIAGCGQGEEKQYMKITGMVPAWSQEQADYTVPCPKNQIELSYRLKEKVEIDGQTATKQGSRTIGLKPGQQAIVKSDGRNYHLRCRPRGMPVPELAQGKGQSPYLITPSLNVFRSKASSKYVMIVDRSGVPVWWYKISEKGSSGDAKMIDPQTVALVPARGVFTMGANSYKLIGLDGKVKKQLSPLPLKYGADHHDLQKTRDGGYLMVAYVARKCPQVPGDCEDLSRWGGPKQANVIDGVIQKLNKNGKLEWEWNSRDHLKLEEFSPWLKGMKPDKIPDGSRAYDIIHINSLEEDGQGVIFSARHANAVYRIKDPAGKGNIDWKLGGTRRAESLKIEDDPRSKNPLSGQHDARTWPDGSLSVYDNQARPSGNPRVVRYKLAGRKAIMVEQIVNRYTTKSFCCGSARRLKNGHWIVSWGAIRQIMEYDRQGNLVMTINIPNPSYRAIPVEETSLSSLRQGMDAQYPR